MHEDDNTTKRGFFHSGLLEGMGLVIDRKMKITKKGNFKKGMLFGLGEIKHENCLLIWGQFGPAEEVKNDWSKFKFVTEEGELLQGTAVLKEESR